MSKEAKVIDHAIAVNEDTGKVTLYCGKGKKKTETVYNSKAEAQAVLDYLATGGKNRKNAFDPTKKPVVTAKQKETEKGGTDK